MTRRPLLAALALAAAGALLPSARAVASSGAALPVFDAHIHYSHDAWDLVPTAEVIALMREAGLRRALVSSSDDEGTQRLLAAAPDLVVPACAPTAGAARSAPGCATRAWSRTSRSASPGTATRRSASSTCTAPTPTCRCRAAWSSSRASTAWCCTRTPTPTRSSACSGRIPDARILWAHSGFDRPENVRALLRKHRNLWADLAFRSEHGVGGKVGPAWREAFFEFPDRFMVGTDTFTPERWHYIPEHADWTRGWLADLPRAARRADRVAQRRGAAAAGLGAPASAARRARRLARRPRRADAPRPAATRWPDVARGEREVVARLADRTGRDRRRAARSRSTPRCARAAAQPARRCSRWPSTRRCPSIVTA